MTGICPFKDISSDAYASFLYVSIIAISLNKSVPSGLYNKNIMVTAVGYVGSCDKSIWTYICVTMKSI